MSNIWLPEDPVKQRFPHVKIYKASDVWLAAIPGFPEGFLALAGESDIDPSEMERKVLEAAYGSILQRDDNVALRLAVFQSYRLVGIEFPLFLEPTSDAVGGDVLLRLREAVPELRSFEYPRYFMPMSSKMLPQANLWNELMVGILDHRTPEGPEGYDRFPVGDRSGRGPGSVLADSISAHDQFYARDTKPPQQPHGMPKIRSE